MRSSYSKTLHGIISSRILYCVTAVVTIYRSLFAFLPLRLSIFSLPLLFLLLIGHTIVSKEELERNSVLALSQIHFMPIIFFAKIRWVWYKFLQTYIFKAKMIMMKELLSHYVSSIRSKAYRVTC